jgi:SHS2 domain-containing protein
VFEILQHTADIRLHVRASSVEELFRDAMRGLFAIMNATSAGAPITRRLTLEGVDRTDLLVDFLSAALSRAHIDRAVFDDVRFHRLTETELDAEIVGREQAGFEQDVKAVTYHEADVREREGVWETGLVLDI